MGKGEDVSCTCIYTDLRDIGGGIKTATRLSQCQACKNKDAERERLDVQNEKYKREHLGILQCDDCGKPTGVWVYDNDLNGSLFICNRCKLKYPSKEII